MVAGSDGKLGDASNVLVLAPSLGGVADGPCFELLSTGDIDQTNVLLTTFTRTPDQCVAEWVDHVGKRPADLSIVSVGERTRSAAAKSAPAERSTTPSLVETVPNPEDLTGLGIKLSEQLRAWDDTKETVVCFDSLTALLQTVEMQTAFRFLHVLTGRLDVVGATAHYHLDPDAFDDKTVNTIKTLFDAAIEVDGDDWTVRTK